MTYDEMKEVVDEFFGDKSRTVAETHDALEELRDEIDVMIDSLEDYADGGEDD